jgi:hypothetical protein
MKDLGHGFTLVDRSIYKYDSEKFTSLKKTIDYDSFEVVEAFEDKTFYFRDKNKVYVTSYMCTASVIDGVNPETFKVINAEDGIGYDGNDYYWYGTRLPYDYTAAEKYNEYYLRAGDKVYFLTDIVDGADTKTFSIIWQNIARDSANLFFRGSKVPEVDVDTFKKVPGCFDAYHLDQSHTYYAADRNNVYFVNTIGKALKKLNRVKPSAFSVKIIDNRLYGISDNDIYFFGIKKKSLLPSV